MFSAKSCEFLPAISLVLKQLIAFNVNPNSFNSIERSWLVAMARQETLLSGLTGLIGVFFYKGFFLGISEWLSKTRPTRKIKFLIEWLDNY